MDNITHSLVGALVAEVALVRMSRASDRATPHFRTLALTASVVANNFPDLDFVYRRVTGGKLGYLLHHRGHTHTLPGAFALGALTLAVVLGWAAARRMALAPSERRTLMLLSLLGPFIHIALDYTNNYGVHPFWPLDDRWYYGDAVFIVEPLLWAVAIPPLALSSASLLARVLFATLLGASLVLGASNGLLSFAQSAALCAVATVMTAVSARASARRRPDVGLAAWLAVTALFFVEGRVAKARVREASTAEFPTTRLVDIVTTPLPANPFCWSALTLGTDGDRYVARRATVWTAPWRRRSPCKTFDGPTSTAPFNRMAIVSGGVRFEREFVAPLGELRSLAERSCSTRVFLRYTRAPFWTVTQGRTVVGDLRFDRSRALEFTEFEVPDPDPCPHGVPPWQPPRADLLE